MATRNRRAGSDWRSGFFFRAYDVHPKAIYIHQGQQYHVERLDFEQRKAYVKPRERGLLHRRDSLYAGARAGDRGRGAIAGPAARAHGDVLVRSQVVGFKKIKFFTNENVGAGKLELPENEMHTTAFWITLERTLLAGLPFALSRAAERNFRAAVRAGVDGDAASDVRPARSGDGGRRAACEPGDRNGVAWTFATANDDPTQMKEFFEPNLYLYDAIRAGSDSASRFIACTICCCGGRRS